MINNMRDLGGIKTADNKVIRSGMLVRSAQLSEAVPEDLMEVSEVIDLRTPMEREESPDRSYSADYLPISIFDHMIDGISHENNAIGHSIPDMTRLYEQLMKECAGTFRKVILEIMDHDYSSGAVLWHCTEGKDRCGITTALVLEILGVSREVIMEDYLKTNLVNLPKARKMEERISKVYGTEAAAGVYQAYIADETYLQAAWDSMGEDYIHKNLQIDDQMILDFREKILLDVSPDNETAE